MKRKMDIWSLYAFLVAIVAIIGAGLFSFFQPNASSTFHTALGKSVRLSDNRCVPIPPDSQKSREVYFVGCGGFF